MKTAMSPRSIGATEVTRRAVCTAGVAALSGACASHGAPVNDDQRLSEALSQSDETSLRLNPQFAVARGDLRFADQFGDFVSDGYFSAVEQGARADLSRLRAIDRHALTDGAKTAYDVFEYQTEATIASFDIGVQRILQHLPIDPYTGLHLSFPQWSSGTNVAPFNSLADYENGLRRLEGYARYLDGASEQMRAGIGAGHVMSRRAVEALGAQLTDILNEGAEASPFMGPIGLIPDAIAAERDRLDERYRTTLARQVMPATVRLRDFVMGDYLRASRAGPPGLVGMTDGPALYAYWLEQHTTTKLTADEIHAMGLSEVARLRAEMERTKQATGFNGDLAAFFAYLRSASRFKPTSTQDLLSRYRAIHERVAPFLPRLFGTLPRGSVEIRPVPPEQESSAGAAYYILGSPDGERPGVFYVNTSDLESRPTPPMTSLFMHEAVPGHHMQGTLAQENMALPALLRFGWNTGFGEGWALYAESLGRELGLYDDPYIYFGHLDLQMFRALRLVVDTGIHAKEWSWAQSVDYMLANSSQHRSYVEQEVDRYISWPGQATAYKVGELVIRELRRNAEQAQGSRFDIRAFHDRVLGAGCLPLHILQRRMSV